MIIAEQLVHDYGGAPVLAGVSFHIGPGELVGYLGPNGAGKSTTIKILCGLLRPKQGRAIIGDCDLAVDPLGAKRRLGYLPEGAALYDNLTPNEYLSLLAELHSLDRSTAAERAAKLLQLFDLTGAADRTMTGFSKGMRQKVAIAAALLHDPDVVLLDEPLNGLDVNAGLALRRLLQEMAARGKTILFCSHLLEVVERLCPRVIILFQGRVAADGKTTDLLAKRGGHGLEEVFRELTGGAKEAQWSEWATQFFADTAK